MGWYNHGHPPDYLARNGLFRLVFLFRKLFFTKRKRSYYGQEGEDVALRRIFQKQKTGFFVDVGCFHPIKYNNTYLLYKKGWRGINIDIDAIKIQGFNWLRRKDINIACAVSAKKGTMDYWTNGFYSLVNTLDNQVATQREGYRKATVETDTLTNIIDKTEYKNTPIDLLCVDAEGHDLVVLQSLDFSRYRPGIVVVESYAAEIESVTTLPIYQFLVQKNYTLINWVGLSLFFKRKDFTI